MRTEAAAQPGVKQAMPLYAAGFGAAAVGLAALGTTVNDPAFIGTAFGLLTVGFFVSWGIRSGRIPRHAMERIGLLLLGVLLVAVIAVPDVKEDFLPAEFSTAADVAMASILAWLMVVYSFTLVTNRAVLFICVPSLSLIGLISTFGPDTEIIAYFVLFMLFAAFALVEQNALSTESGNGPDRDALRFRMGLTACVVLLALLAGVVIRLALYPLADTMFTRAIMGNPAISPDQTSEEELMPVAAGPVALSEHEVMTVKCDRPLSWRGQVFDKYSGRYWSNTVPRWGQDTVPQTRVVASAGRLRGYAVPWDPQSGERTKWIRIEQTFTCTGMPSKTIFAAAEPEWVGFHGLFRAVTMDRSLHAMYPYRRGDRYTVVSAVSTATAEELRKAGEDYKELIKDYYRRTPESCWRIEKITRRVIAGKRSAYDKALAIQTYLESNYTYDTRVPAAPPNEDAVSHFLLTSKRGYCDVFASALVIMCRQAGIPARVVTGYATGEYNQEDGLYHIRQKDRHAWGEVYFPKYGWIAFDPAPSEDETSTASLVRKALIEVYRALMSGSPGAWMTLLIVLLAAYLTKTELIDRLRRKSTWAGDQPSTIMRAAENYKRMCAILAKHGHPRHPSATPSEYALYLAGALPAECDASRSAVEAATDDFIEARYALHELPVSRVERSASLLSRMKNEMARNRRCTRE